MLCRKFDSEFIPFGFHTSPPGATFRNGKIEYFVRSKNILFSLGQGLCPCRSPAPMRWSCSARNPRYRGPWGAELYSSMSLILMFSMAAVFLNTERTLPEFCSQLIEDPDIQFIALAFKSDDSSVVSDQYRKIHPICCFSIKPGVYGINGFPVRRNISATMFVPPDKKIN